MGEVEVRAPGDDVVATVDLAITGMHCAGCVARIEKEIARVPGARGVVNLPLESAHVELTVDTDPDALVAAVAAAGYEARVVSKVSVGAPEDEAPPARDDRLVARLVVGAILSVPVVAISMISALQFSGWPWVVAALALPVAGWCAWPFHAAAFRAARHGASTMDTLVSLGVIAASAWSLVVLILGDALHSSIGIDLPGPGHHHGEDLYFEVAAVVTVFLLAGRVLESRARRRGGDALRALLDLGARDAEVVGATARVPIDQLAPGDLFTVRPGEKIATDGVVVTGVSALDLSFLTGETRPVDVGPGDQVT
ncbi:MAG: cation transporter, partial [Micrococcales bacterium]|nr:cation transporter [Micrococcales bacterium]